MATGATPPGRGPGAEGEVVGGAYRLLARIGSGGMGTVYRALELASQRQVAVKLLLPFRASPTRLARFAREAQVTARLDHPGVVRVHASGEHRGAPFIAMELVEGEDLERRLEAGPLPVEEARATLEAVARAVGACHAAGVVHRDLKPANVLLAPGGPKVVDFGLAFDDSSERLTRTGELLGTPGYMAPEQLEGRRGVGAPADVYALGAMLHHALTGAPPFDAPTLLELAARVAVDAPTPPSRLRPGVPPDLDAVVLRALAKRPAERYPDALALAEDLARVGRGERPAAPAARRRGVPLGAALAGAALLAAGAAGLAALARARSAGPRAALERVLEWDGDRCELRPAACRGGPHALARWDLGLGQGAAPAPQELDAARAELEAAAGDLDAAGALEARAEADRLLALRELLAPAAPGAAPDRAAGATRRGGAGTCTGELVHALALRAAGDAEAAFERVERALALEPGAPAALRLRARLWADRLAAGSPAATRAFVAWLRARGRGPDELRLGREAAVQGLARAALGALRRAPAARDEGLALAAELDACAAAGRELQVDADVAALVSAGRAAALEEEAAAWAEAARTALRAGPRADDALLGRLRLALGDDAPAGPALGAALRGAVEERVAAMGRDADRLTRAARFERAVAYHTGSAQPPPEALASAATAHVEGGLRVDLDLVDLDVVLVFLASATTRGVQLDTLVRRMGPERVTALLARRPRSLALRACALELELRASADPAQLPRAVPLVDALLEGARPDLADPYLAEALEIVAWVRRGQLDAALQARELERAAALGRTVVELARRTREAADLVHDDARKDMWRLEAETAGFASFDEGLATWERALADFRARVGGQVRPSHGRFLERDRECASLAKLLVHACGWLDAAAPQRPAAERPALAARTLAWGREAVQASLEVTRGEQAVAGRAHLYLCRRLRAAGEAGEAAALMAGAPEGAWEDLEFALEACRLAGERGDRAAVEERVARLLALHGKDRAARRLARELGVDPRGR